MKYEMTLLLAENKINNFMEAVDLKHKGKWYVYPTQSSFSYEKEIKPELFLNIIKKSKENKNGFWVPGIVFCGTLYKDDSVTELSDGERILYAGGNNERNTTDKELHSQI